MSGAFLAGFVEETVSNRKQKVSRVTGFDRDTEVEWISRSNKGTHVPRPEPEAQGGWAYSRRQIFLRASAWRMCLRPGQRQH